jgi:hypothetical protein
MQMVNSAYQIWDKIGNSLLGPFTLSTIWSGFPGPWASSLNDGDPVVLYDQAADRWFASEFSLPNGGNGPEYILIAISATPDPTGTWHRYGFEFPEFPDYPHYGVWPDGYYMSVNRFAPGFTGTYTVAFERDSMLVGYPAQFVISTNSPFVGASFLPSDWDGTTAPPTGAPNYFTGLGSNNLRTYEFHVDWVTPANSTFTGPLITTTSPFSEPGSIPQLGTSTTLDDLADRLMQRLQYRNFGTHQTMVICHSIDDGGGRSGVRWYELRNTGSGWTLFQEGTYAPADGLERWMGSIAMNGSGDIGLGYSVSSSTINPEIRYTGRHDGDPLGTMTITEGTIHSSGGSQTNGLSRWGDYSQMSVDPVDDQTFWYSQEYIPSNGSFNWNTRIASFVFGPPCPVGFASNPDPANGATDVGINIGQITWTNGTGATSIEVWFDGVMVYSGAPITSWNIPILNYSTTYMWRVDGSDGNCTTSGVVWSFTTMDDPSQVIAFIDDFSTSANWSAVNLNDPCDWGLSTIADIPGSVWGSPNFPPTADNFYAFASSDACGTAQAMNAYFIGNFTIDASLYQNVRIEFDSDFEVFQNPTPPDTGAVDVSIDGGATWTRVFLRQASTAAEHVVVDISGLAGLQGDISFRLFYYGDYSWHWALDNFAVYLLGLVPVELTSFAATINEDDIVLNWATATETNNRGFEIQRTPFDSEGKQANWDRIAFVEGHGTTTDIQSYSFTDKDLAAGKYSYRLKQIDFNGAFDYSNEVIVEVTVPLEFAMEQNYPNPFNPSTVIKYSIAEDGFVTLDVFNLLGEKVVSLVSGIQKAGRYEVNFNAANLASGVYVYNLKSDNFSLVKKMLLLR